MATPIPTNAASFSLGEIATAVHGTRVGGTDDVRVTGVAIDSRAVVTGGLFVAIAGETHDGHAFLAAARERGAAAVLVRRGTRCDLPAIEVDDTLGALGDLARHFVDRAKARRTLPSIAITGSAGKTTTKELTAAAARALFGATLATQGNLNNRVGVPMTLLTLDETHRALVIECGTSARGEIAMLGAIVRPDVGVVLNADAGHTLGLGTVEDVAIEKGALFAAARRAVVANADDTPSRQRLNGARVPSLLFGLADGSDVRLVSRTPRADGIATIRVAIAPALVAPGVEPLLELELSLLGEAAALDACAAIAAVAAARGAPLTQSELAQIRAALSDVRATPGRMAALRASGALVIDDTYNANPRSVRASLATAREIATALGSRLLVVLGDMLELGELSAQLHTEIGVAVVAAGAATFVTVGTEMALAARAAAVAGERAPIVVETQHTDDAATVVASIVRPGDVVLVKGSRGMRMEAVVQALARRDGGQS